MQFLSARPLNSIKIKLLCTISPYSNVSCWSLRPLYPNSKHDTNSIEQFFWQAFLQNCIYIVALHKYSSSASFCLLFFLFHHAIPWGKTVTKKNLPCSIRCHCHALELELGIKKYLLICPF